MTKQTKSTVIAFVVLICVGIGIFTLFGKPSEAKKVELAQQVIDTWARGNGGRPAAKAESVKLVWSGKLVDVFRADVPLGVGFVEMEFRIAFDGRKARIEKSWLTAAELNRIQGRVEAQSILRANNPF